MERDLGVSRSDLRTELSLWWEKCSRELLKMQSVATSKSLDTTVVVLGIANSFDRVWHG